VFSVLTLKNAKFDTSITLLSSTPNASAILVNAGYGFDIYVRAGDQINFRSPTSGTTTLVLGRLDSIKDEG